VEPNEREAAGLDEEELESQAGEQLPDREVMSTIGTAGEPTFEIGLPPPRD
jgi:hypothetical protein